MRESKALKVGGIGGWSDHLRAGDPLSVEGGVSGDEARAMRRVVVAATRGSRAATRSWPHAFAVLATIGLALVLGIVIGNRLPVREVVPTKMHTTERRQIQFETPGGTRINWTLNSDFGL